MQKKNKHKSQYIQINFKKNHQINTLLLFYLKFLKQLSYECDQQKAWDAFLFIQISH